MKNPFLTGPSIGTTEWWLRQIPLNGCLLVFEGRLKTWRAQATKFNCSCFLLNPRVSYWKRKEETRTGTHPKTKEHDDLYIVNR